MYISHCTSYMSICAKTKYKKSCAKIIKIIKYMIRIKKMGQKSKNFLVLFFLFQKRQYKLRSLKYFQIKNKMSRKCKKCSTVRCDKLFKFMFRVAQNKQDYVVQCPCYPNIRPSSLKYLTLLYSLFKKIILPFSFLNIKNNMKFL